jgi:hypothetical protein
MNRHIFTPNTLANTPKVDSLARSRPAKSGLAKLVTVADVVGGIASRTARSELGEDEDGTAARKHPTAVRGAVMSLLPRVVEAKHRGDYRLLVVFSDGTENTIDFRPWLDGPVFEPLKDLAFFKRAFVDGGTVVWPNGADIAPETLYEVSGRRRRPSRRLQPTKARRRSVKKRADRPRLRG